MSEHSKLIWRCRRGTLELDLLLTRYLERCYQQADSDEQQQFEYLLTLEDPQLQRYLMGQSHPQEAVLAALVEKIRALPLDD